MKQFALVGVFVGCCLVKTDRPALATAMVQIAQSSSIPTNALRRISRSEKSRFFGSAKFCSVKKISFQVLTRRNLDKSLSENATGMKYYVASERQYKHLYFQSDRNGIASGKLDLSITNDKRDSKRLRLLCSIPFAYISSGQADESVRLSTGWLDPKQKCFPLIMVDFSGDNHFFGEQGASILFIFSKSLIGHPTIQAFGHGNDSGTDAHSWNWNFNGIDSRGFLQIRSIHATRGETKTTLLNWIGGSFTVTKQKVEQDN